MKKIILSIACLLLITGCKTNITNINIEDTKDIIESSLTNMEKISDDVLVDVYGLDLDSMKSYIIKQNSDGDFYAIIKANDKTKVKNSMKKYFEKVEKFNTSYSPERLEIFNNRVEKEIGDCLIYIIAQDGDSIYERIVDSL